MSEVEIYGRIGIFMHCLLFLGQRNIKKKKNKRKNISASIAFMMKRFLDSFIGLHVVEPEAGGHAAR